MKVMDRLRFLFTGKAMAASRYDVLRALGGYQAASFSGVTVTEETAMRIGAVNACVRLISENLGSLPLEVFRRKEDGGKEVARDHRLYRILHDRPNAYQTSMAWREMSQAHVLMRGASYSKKSMVDKQLDELLPIHPDRISIVMQDGRVVFKHYKDDGQLETLEWDEVLYIPGLSSDILSPRSVLSDARESLGLAFASDAFQGKQIAAGGSARVVLEVPNELEDGSVDRMQDSWEKAYGGVEKMGKPLILESGTKASKISLTADELQFIESRRFNIADIARFFRVPMHMIGELDRSTNNNIEQQSLEFLTYTLRPWLVRWEQWLSLSLLGEDKDHFVEFNADALLRGNTKDRYQAYHLGRQAGFLSVNEIRARENMNPIGPDGDVYLDPENMRPAGEQEPEPEKKNGQPSAAQRLLQEALKTRNGGHQ